MRTQFSSPLRRAFANWDTERKKGRRVDDGSRCVSLFGLAYESVAKVAGSRRRKRQRSGSQMLLSWDSSSSRQARQKAGTDWGQSLKVQKPEFRGCQPRKLSIVHAVRYMFFILHFKLSCCPSVFFFYIDSFMHWASEQRLIDNLKWVR